jgi:hypothetical protein
MGMWQIAPIPLFTSPVHGRAKFAIRPDPSITVATGQG